MPDHFESERCGTCGAALSGYAPNGLCAACLLDSAFEEAARPLSEPSGAAPLLAFHGYEVLEEIARGGMGVVYRARQARLDRLVAIKMILGGSLANAAEMKRFRAEAAMAAQLQHPNIVAIHEIGECGGLPFFSMDLVNGRSLAQLVRDEPLPARKAAAYLKTIAEAVQFAHSHGVLHRDLKPSNILIDENGQPRITDFGLAKRLRPDFEAQMSELTQTGQVLGSPSFIPPEQAAGQKASVGPASDVYSLGAILYQCLTARPPFMAETLPQTLRMVAENEPVSPRLLNPGVPQDLETICLKCLSKEPRHRYSTAQELADELGCFLEDKSIRARPSSSAQKFARWCRRHPALAMVSGLALLLLLAIGIISTTAAVRLKAANRWGLEKLRDSYGEQARANRWSGRLGRRFASLRALQQAAEIRPSLDLRNEAIACLALPDLVPVRSFEKPEGCALLDINGASDSLIVMDPTGLVAMRRLSDGGTLREFDRMPLPIRCSALEKGGRYLAVGSGNGPGTIQVFDLASGATIRQWTNVSARNLVFSMDGRLLLSAQKVGEQPLTVTAFALQSNSIAYETRLSALPYSLGINRTETRLAMTSDQTRKVLLLDPLTGATLGALEHPARTWGLAWHPAEELLAVGCGDGFVHLWDLSTDPPGHEVLDHGSVATQLSFSADGTLLASAGWNNELRLWEIRTRRELARKPDWGVARFQKSDDGWQVICQPTERRIEICAFATGQECSRVLALNGATGSRHCAFSPDGRLLVSSHGDGFRIWDLAKGSECGFAAEGATTSAQFDPAGERLFTTGDAGFSVWDVARVGTDSDLKIRLSFRETFVEGRKMHVAALDAAASCAAVPVHGWMEVVDLRTGIRRLPQWRQDMPEPIGAPVFSPDARRFFASGDRMYSWDLNAEGASHSLPLPGFTAVTITRDGRTLMAGTGDDYTAWETRDWKQKWRFPRENSGGMSAQLSLSPDGLLGAASVSLAGVRLFEPSSGRELATMEAPESATISWLTFSPDGSRLAVASAGPVLRVWDLHALRRQLAAMNLDWAAPPSPVPVTNGWARRLAVVIETNRVPPRVPARDPRCTAAQIDLSSHYNCTFANFALMSGLACNDLSTLPAGFQDFAGTDFDVRAVVQVAGQKGSAGSRGRAEATGIRVGRECRALCFLHSCISAESRSRGAVLGEYVVHYSDDRTETIPLRNEENIADWWDYPPARRAMAAGTSVAWRGTNRAAGRVANDVVLYKFRWENPRPGSIITSLDFRSALTGASPFLVALTAE